MHLAAMVALVHDKMSEDVGDNLQAAPITLAHQFDPAS